MVASGSGAQAAVWGEAVAGLRGPPGRRGGIVIISDGGSPAK
jgi:hypothetical protein